MPGRFVPNPKFAKDFLGSDAALELARKAGEQGADVARRLAPNDPATGAPDIESSIQVVEVEDERGKHVEIQATDWKAAWHEKGTSEMPAHPFLRPALEALGLTVEDTRGA